jgi:hypothetical protein
MPSVEILIRPVQCYFRVKNCKTNGILIRLATTWWHCRAFLGLWKANGMHHRFPVDSIMWSFSPIHHAILGAASTFTSVDLPLSLHCEWMVHAYHFICLQGKKRARGLTNRMKRRWGRHMHASIGHAHLAMMMLWVLITEIGTSIAVRNSLLICCWRSTGWCRLIMHF